MPTLLFENGPDRGSGAELTPGRTYDLGRDPRADIVVRDELVSRHHCKLKEFKGAWYIKDNASRNGVYLNNQRLQQAEIRFGDKLQLGGAVLTFLEESLDQVKQEHTLGGYRLRQRIGRGGMGTVFQALQVSLGREVALKVLSPHLVRDAKFVDQFFREARAAGQLNHPHIVQVYDVGQEGDQYFYSMEYIDGGSLEDRLRAEGKVGVDEAVEIVRQAALALEFAESKHIVHRDIKPDNLMLTAHGQVKIADLGLALSLKETADEAGQPILGTPHFISPEQALRREVDIRSDIYSLGATLYRMLSGRTLFEGQSAEDIIRKAVRQEPVPIRELNPEVPEKVAQIVQRMIQKDPDDRYPTARELREDVERLGHRTGKTVALWSSVGIAVIAVTWAAIASLTRPDTEIVTVRETDEQSKHEAYAAKSALEKMVDEQAALRSYYRETYATGAEYPGDAELEKKLASWLEQYDYLPIPETEEAQTRLEALRTRLREVAEAARREEERRERLLASARERIEGSLARNDFLAALEAALALEPDPESGAETGEVVAAERTRFLAQVQAAEQALFERYRADLERTSKEKQWHEALSLLDEAAALFLPPDAATPEPYADVFRAHHDWLVEQREHCTAQARLVAERTRRSDLRTVVETMSSPWQRAVLSLELDRAADLLDEAAREVTTERYRKLLVGPIRSLRTGAEILEGFLTALEDGSLKQPPSFSFPDSEPGEVEDYLPEERVLRLRFRMTPGPGSVARNTPLKSLATPDGLFQLASLEFPLEPDEAVRVAELLLLVEVCRWADQIQPLEASLKVYNPDEGWNDSLKVDLPPLPNRPGESLPALLRRLMDSHPQATQEVQAVIASMEAEQRARDELLGAIAPFLAGQGTSGWSAASTQLRKLLEDHPASLLVRIIYATVHSGTEFPLGESP